MHDQSLAQSGETHPHSHLRHLSRHSQRPCSQTRTGIDRLTRVHRFDLGTVIVVRDERKGCQGGLVGRLDQGLAPRDALAVGPVRV